MGIKPIASWSDDEVATWLHCIDLDDKIGSFTANAVDGGLLLTLNREDLTGDLGLSSLQAKKFLQQLEFTKSLPEGGGGGDDLSEEMQQLQISNKDLETQIRTKDARIEELERELAALRPPPSKAPAPVPAPAPKAAPPPKQQGGQVVKGAAHGAATGAVKGAVVGAVLPGMDASDGAKAGAAAGAAGGAMDGMAAKRRMRR